MENKSNHAIIEDILSNIKSFKSNYDVNSFGYVASIKDGVAEVVGLKGATIGEMVTINGVKGLILNLKEGSVDVILLDKYADKVFEGLEVRKENKSVSVPVGMNLLGRVVNALGQPIDDKGEIESSEEYPIERDAPSIIDRKSVHEPLATGIKIIDSLIPIGRGQRELIIGDRQTGKTTIAIDTIINQSKINKTKEYAQEKVYCIYVAIGQKQSNIVRIAQELEKNGALEDTIIVSAGISDEASAQFLAPYTGCAMGEYFRDNGMHALVIYDDLSKHAVAYRQISLLLRRPPGREAYPGDVFYLHSRLLERAAKMSDEKGSGSLTALPIMETQAGDISAYIPTNVISITDGQIFLESDLFHQGFRPAINIALSVSRVGGAAQTKAMKKVTGTLKLDFAQYREMESFAKFGSDIDETTKKILQKGAMLSSMITQKNANPMSLTDQVISLFASTRGLAMHVPAAKIKQYEKELIEHIHGFHKEICNYIQNNLDISKEVEEKLYNAIKSFTENFLN